MKRWLLSIVAWIVSSVVLAPVLFFVVMFLAGPHSSVLPGAMQSVVAVLGLITLVALPIWIARKVWLRA